MRIHYIAPVKNVISNKTISNGRGLVEGKYYVNDKLSKKSKRIIVNVAVVAVAVVLFKDNLFASNAVKAFGDGVIENKESVEVISYALGGPADSLGLKLVDGTQTIGYYIALAMCMFEVIKSFIESDPKRIPGVLTKFSIGLASLYGAPIIFKTIKDAF